MNHAENLNIYWVDFDGIEQIQSTFAPGEVIAIQTYETHAFRVRDLAKKIIQEYVATDQELQAVEVNADNTTEPPAQIQPETVATAVPIQSNPLLRSGDGSTKVTLEVVNKSNETLKFYWVDFNGIEQSFGDLTPNGTITQGTSSTHAWRIKDASGNLLFEYVVKEQKTQTIEIGADMNVTTR